MEATNLQSPQVYKIWRTEAATEDLTVEFGADRTVDILACVFLRKTGLAALDLSPDFASTDTIRHRLYDSGNGLLWDSTALASGVDPQVGYHVLDVKALNGASVDSVRKWVIDFTGTSRVAAGYFDVGRIWAGETFQPTANYNFGARFAWDDGSKISRAARSHAEFVDVGAMRRIWTVNFNSLRTADETQFDQMERLIGLNTQMLFCKADSGDLHDQTILCRQDKAQGISQTNVERFAKSMRLIESM